MPGYWLHDDELTPAEEAEIRHASDEAAGREYLARRAEHHARLREEFYEGAEPTAVMERAA